MTNSERPRGGFARSWLSQGLETLMHDRAQGLLPGAGPHWDCDVLIVGSGYGGAVAAEALAGRHADEAGRRPLQVWVLERGREWLPGSFPDRLAELPGHVRYTAPGARAPAGRREALFDLRLGPDVACVLGNGLGGGSLINAGVMAFPQAQVFDNPAWPPSLRREYAALTRCAESLKQALGARALPAQAPGGPTPPAKFTALRRLAGGAAFVATATTIAHEGGQSPDGVALQACRRCGDCATGCNHGAKVSLDVSLLAAAHRRGARLVTGATVLRLRRAPSGGWEALVHHTDEQLRQRQGEPFVIRARRVIVAAGTYGSTELLMRSRSRHLDLSPRLGERFSANGDLIALALDQHDTVNAIARDDQPVGERRVGPTITGMIDTGLGHVIQDLAIPTPLHRLFEELATTARTLDQLNREDPSVHGDEAPAQAAGDDQGVDRALLDRSSVLALIGHDSAEGRLVPGGGAVHGRRPHAHDEEGLLNVQWPTLKHEARWLDQLHDLEARCSASGMGGRVLANPLWRPLHGDTDALLDRPRGPLLSVHPLGGCAMGLNRWSGVVNEWGQVFGPGDEVFDDLVVLDGSIVPTSLGINPALTIATLARRALDHLMPRWGLGPRAGKDQPAPRHRPWFRVVPEHRTCPPTLVELAEQMRGVLPDAWSPVPGSRPAPRGLEITLRSRPAPLAELARGGLGHRTLVVDTARSHLRVVGLGAAPEGAADWSEAATELTARLSGTLQVLHREASSPWQRKTRALWAWLRNRGLRDMAQTLIEREAGLRPQDDEAPGLRRRGRHAVKVASRAGEARLIAYDLALHDTRALQRGAWRRFPAMDGRHLRGHKRLTYGRRSNPVDQLMTMQLTRFPGVSLRRRPPRLRLHLPFLVDEGMPLMRVVRAADMPSALMDMLGLLLWVARVVVNMHVWSMRRPDTPPPRPIARLPGPLDHLPAQPEIIEIDTDAAPPGRPPVRVRLTRYPRRDAAHPPVLLLHGYSASGTTFAHAALAPGLAPYLWAQGHDVWIADLRTSPGLPTATQPWAFEDVAYKDIPLAVEHLCQVTGVQRVDIVAHCMGSVMLWMALLGPALPGVPEAAEAARRRLPARVRRLVMSQVAPLVDFAPGNLFRAFVMRHLGELMPRGRYDFRPEADTKAEATAQPWFDRLLALLPYPADDFDHEHPTFPPWQRTPWSQTRRRMDALYGRDFNLGNVTPALLERLDDHFGPLNLETLRQALHLARTGTLANRAGDNVYLSPARLARLLDDSGLRMLSVHGRDNGLSDVEGLRRFHRYLQALGPVYAARHECREIPGYGHQDCLIGKDAHRDVFPHVGEFLARPDLINEDSDAWARSQAEAPGACAFHIDLPALGPILGQGNGGGAGLGEQPGPWTLTLGHDPVQGPPWAVALVPVMAGESRGRDAGEEDGDPHEPTLPPGTHLLPWPVACGDVVPAPEDAVARLPLPGTAWPPGARGLLVVLVHARRALPPAPELARHVGPSPSPAPGALQAWCQALQHALHGALQAHRDSPFLIPAPRTLSLPASQAPLPPAGLRLLVAGCLYPAGLLDRAPLQQAAAWPHPGEPLPPCGPANQSLHDIAQWRQRHPDTPLDLALLIGDQIYADATAGLFDPPVADGRYTRAHRQWLGNRYLVRALLGLPVHTLPDDHEITDNWEALSPGHPAHRANEQLRDAALHSYRHHQHFAWPPLRHEQGDMPAGRPRFAYAFDQGGLPFFMADTRTEREPRRLATLEQAHIMDRAQWDALSRWLAVHGPAPRPAFIACPSIVLPRRLATDSLSPATALRSDAWDGYPRSLHGLLARLYDVRARQVVLLSGDEHLSSAVEITLRREGDGPQDAVVLHSVHSSALYAPYPFANTLPEDLRFHDDFHFEVPQAGQARRYHCRVRPLAVSPGDGFAILAAEPPTGDQGWRVRLRFVKAGDGAEADAAPWIDLDRP